MLVFMTNTFECADAQQNGKHGNDEKRDSLTVDLEGPVGILIKNFFSRIVIKRDLNSALGFFCEKENYMKFKEVPETASAKEINYLHERDLYYDDCSRIIEMLPKVNVDYIKLQKIESLANFPLCKYENSSVYKAVFTYGEGGNRFEVVFPTVVENGKDLKFATRFWIPLRLTM